MLRQQSWQNSSLLHHRQRLLPAVVELRHFGPNCGVQRRLALRQRQHPESRRDVSPRSNESNSFRKSYLLAFIRKAKSSCVIASPPTLSCRRLTKSAWITSDISAGRGKYSAYFCVARKERNEASWVAEGGDGCGVNEGDGWT